MVKKVLRQVSLFYFQNVGKTQVRKKCECCFLTSLQNNRIHTFSKLEFSEHFGNEANRCASSKAMYFELCMQHGMSKRGQFYIKCGQFPSTFRRKVTKWHSQFRLNFLPSKPWYSNHVRCILFANPVTKTIIASLELEYNINKTLVN